jgi:hypothetical protein
MISEFFGFEELFIFGWVKWVHLALIPFVSGLLFIAFYYIFVRKSVMDD